MNALQRRVIQLREAAHQATQEFLRALDREGIAEFQRVFYCFIISAGLYLWLAVSVPPQALEKTLGTLPYQAWLTLNVLCPTATLVGRWLTKLSASIKAGEPNPAYGAAWLQLTGDLGTWLAICIYVACVFDTSWWGQGLYAVFFVAMGVPAGAMFTLRSVRRLLQIHQRERAARG